MSMTVSKPRRAPSKTSASVGSLEQACAEGTGASAALPIPACNNAALRRATRHLGQLFDGIIAPSGLRAAQHGLLYYIKEMRGPAMKDLARVLVMDQSALGHTLKPLMRDGLVELLPCRQDGRAKRVHLTPAGDAKLIATRDLWQTAQQRVETALGPEKALQMRELLTLIASDDFGDAFRTGTRLG